MKFILYKINSIIFRIQSTYFLKDLEIELKFSTF